jgi:hypothetical protein
MAEQKISELPVAGAITGTENVVINQNAVTSITTVNAIVGYTFSTGATGSFTTANGKTVTVVKGLITSIV